MQCGSNVRHTKKMTSRNLSEEDLWARLLSSCHSRVRVNGLQTERLEGAGRQQLYAALQAFNVDGHTQKRKLGRNLPMGMTTPKTATVRFSPRRKCSLPAEKRDGITERH